MRLEINGFVLSLYEDEYREIFVQEDKVRVTNMKNQTKSITLKLPLASKSVGRCERTQTSHKNHSDTKVPAALVKTNPRSPSPVSDSTSSSSLPSSPNVLELEAKINNQLKQFQEQLKNLNSGKLITDQMHTKNFEQLRSELATKLKKLDDDMRRLNARTDTYTNETGLLNIRSEKAKNELLRVHEELDTIWSILRIPNPKGYRYK